MLQSACYLGIDEDDVYNVVNPKLMDGPLNTWDVSLIASLVEDFVKSADIGMVVSFDGYGVSGHPNHIAVSKGVVKFVQESNYN